VLLAGEVLPRGLVARACAAVLHLVPEQLVRRVEAKQRPREPHAQPKLLNTGGVLVHLEHGSRNVEAGRQEVRQEAWWPRLA